MRTPIRTSIDLAAAAAGTIRGARSGAALACAAGLLLAACSDDPAFDGTGGGAGDEENTVEQNLATLTPYAGTYALTGPWRGIPDDEAYLVIRQPDASGESAAALYDLDELDGCYERPRGGSVGTVRVDDFGGGVFLDGIFSFEEASVSLGAGNALAIDHTDAEDVDRDGNRGERVSYVAPREDGLAEADLEPLCS